MIDYSRQKQIQIHNYRQNFSVKSFLFFPISRCLIHLPRSIQTRLKHFYEQTSVITAENL